MTDFMTRGNTTDDEGPMEQSPFEEYDAIRTWNDKDRLIQYAGNALTHLAQHKTATDEDLRAAAIGNDHQILKEGLWAKVAPLIASAEKVEWAGGFSLEADALEHKSDDWMAEASELEIPDTRRYSRVPKAVDHSYRHLERLRERNDGHRPATRAELARNCGVHFKTEEYRRYVEDYLIELPGVSGPADGPAWEYVDTTEATGDEPAEGEAHG